MMRAPLVSIIVAAYQPKPSHFLAAIDSALAQTYPEFEILVVDDSPSNELRDILSCRNDKRLYYYHNVPSLGVAKNHWVAFEKARGEYIAVLNHDDMFEPEFLSNLVDSLQCEPSAVLAFCDHWIMDNDGNILFTDTHNASNLYGRKSLKPGVHQPFGDLFVSQTIPMVMGSVFRRKALTDPLPEHAGPSYDLWLTYFLAKSGGSACYIPKRLSFWRNHAGNLTNTGGLAGLYGSTKCWQAASKNKALGSAGYLAQRKAATGYMDCSVLCWRDGKRMTALKYLVQSLRIHFSFRGLALLLIVPFLSFPLVSALAPKRANKNATSR